MGLWVLRLHLMLLLLLSLSFSSSYCCCYAIEAVVFKGMQIPFHILSLNHFGVVGSGSKMRSRDGGHGVADGLVAGELGVENGAVVALSGGSFEEGMVVTGWSLDCRGSSDGAEMQWCVRQSKWPTVQGVGGWLRWFSEHEDGFPFLIFHVILPGDHWR